MGAARFGFLGLLGEWVQKRIAPTICVCLGSLSSNDTALSRLFKTSKSRKTEVLQEGLVGIGVACYGNRRPQNQEGREECPSRNGTLRSRLGSFLGFGLMRRIGRFIMLIGHLVMPFSMFSIFG